MLSLNPHFSFSLNSCHRNHIWWKRICVCVCEILNNVLHCHLFPFLSLTRVHMKMQITLLNGFTLGKFVSFTHNGCQDAYLEFSEQSRTPIGGAFCGQSWGPSVFFSETRSLVITVKLFKLLRDQSGYNFDFRIDYKFLSKDEAIVRYGQTNMSPLKSEFTENTTRDHHHMLDNKSSNRKNKIDIFPDHADDFMLMKSNWYESTLNLTVPASSSSPGSSSSSIYTERLKNQMKKFNKQQRQQQHGKSLFPSDVKYYLGDLIPGTYCSRIFSDCNKKPCRLQSPNYPGLYPRNLTCYFAVRQVSECDRGKDFQAMENWTKKNYKLWLESKFSISCL